MISVHTFGTSLIQTGRGRITPTATKQFGVLLLLTAEPGRRTPRSMIVDMLFDESADAQHALRELLYQLRRKGVELDADAHGIAVAPAGVFIDWANVTTGAPIEIAALRAAQGGFLPGYAPSLSEEFREWYDNFRATRTFELAKAFNAEMDRAKEAGDWSRS